MNGTTRRLILVPLIAAATLALMPAIARASNALPDGEERTLNGHSFMSSRYIENPFVGTTISNNVGGGLATNLARPFYDLDGNLLFNYEGEIFFAALGLDYQQNIWETWSVRLFIEALARAGSNLESILSEGATVDREIEFMVKKRIWRGEKIQVTGSLDWGYSSTTLFSLREFAEFIWNGGDVEDAPLTANYNVWRSRLGVAAAYAFTPALGLRANMMGGVYDAPDVPGNPEAASGTEGLFKAGIMLDWDLKPRLKVPVGVSLGFFGGSPSDNPLTGASGTTLGIWYTGQKDFTIGLESAYWNRPSYDVTGNSDGAVFLFSMQYWF